MDPVEDSLFADFGGYYSVRVDGLEVARFAPSAFWTNYWKEAGQRPMWTYAWVPTSEGDRVREDKRLADVMRSLIEDSKALGGAYVDVRRDEIVVDGYVMVTPEQETLIQRLMGKAST